ncbi:MAG: zf-HC2 domain-containing protein [Bacillota bacterium]|nr:zf-HC2 domain-containing protein [Bacillota bacterium]
MPCHRTRLMLLPYLHGELSAIAAQEIAAHLAGCPACAAEEALLREEMGQFQVALRAKAPSGLQEGVLLRMRRAHVFQGAGVGVGAGAPGRVNPRRLLHAGVLAAASVALAVAGLAFLWPPAGDMLVSGAARLGSQLSRYAGERSQVWPGLVRAAGALWNLTGL